MEVCRNQVQGLYVGNQFAPPLSHVGRLPRFVPIGINPELELVTKDAERQNVL